MFIGSVQNFRSISQIVLPREIIKERKIEAILALVLAPSNETQFLGSNISRTIDSTALIFHMPDI